MIVGKDLSKTSDVKGAVPTDTIEVGESEWSRSKP